MPPFLPLLTRTLASAAVILAAAAPARAETLSGFFDAHPRYEVLPRPYFEAEAGPASYVEVSLSPYSFLPSNRPWHAELHTDAGVVRHPARGSSRAKRWSAFLPQGDRPLKRAALKLYVHERNGLVRHAATVAVPAMRPERFNATYQRGPRARQLSTAWGEDGAWLVAIQMRHQPRFWRVESPYVYIGGDFLYQRIEGLVRFLRVHGVNALGYRPEYDREGPIEGMAEADYPEFRRFVALAAGDRPAHAVGICVGGIHARGMAFLERQRGVAPRIGSVTTVGCPHQGSALADIYNGHAILPWLHRFMTGDPDLHEYKDSRAAITAFNRAMPPPAVVPHHNVVLDPQGERLDPRYDQMDWALRHIVAAETGRDFASIRTDGLLTPEEQAFGEPLAVWRTDHAGMINDGRASTYFDAYDAHLKLITALDDRLTP